ncbi:hypothetical protein HHK36_014740 [Tetracentron sinense]|uniref:RRP15-like protein n=1 Tax=Tetracentron sinense TaxID=13715 RepID=A0A834Z4X6_TETSI|nr:hypothetical protein HHK36_014740 [Tetracentron sinense]
MAEENQLPEVGKGPRKRKSGHSKGSKAKKRVKVFPGTGEKVRIDKNLRELFRKRAREYNSDDEDESAALVQDETAKPEDHEEVSDGNSSGEEGHDALDATEDGASEDEADEIQPGLAKFKEGFRAFRLAFKKITKEDVAEDSLGPVLSRDTKLVAEKLADEEAQRKNKGDAKKEKHLLGEKGHVKPANFLDAHEKFLIGVATKGVVKLFNAVNKAQNAQKGLNPSRFKDAKAIGKRRKEAFFSELRKTPSQMADSTAKVSKFSGLEDDNGPAWAPLRDGYMLTSSKLKNWDKMPDTTVADDIGGMPLDSSSDDD